MVQKYRKSGGARRSGDLLRAEGLSYFELEAIFFTMASTSFRSLSFRLVE
jgi:hypothetical protein